MFQLFHLTKKHPFQQTKIQQKINKNNQPRLKETISLLNINFEKKDKNRNETNLSSTPNRNDHILRRLIQVSVPRKLFLYLIAFQSGFFLKTDSKAKESSTIPQ